MGGRYRVMAPHGGELLNCGRRSLVSACLGNGEYGDEDEQNEWEELDDCEAPELDDEPFDPEPTDEEVWGDFPWDDQSDEEMPPPEELWSDADWE